METCAHLPVSEDSTLWITIQKLVAFKFLLDGDTFLKFKLCTNVKKVICVASCSTYLIFYDREYKKKKKCIGTRKGDLLEGVAAMANIFKKKGRLLRLGSVTK